ncbi:hypothetical protein V6N11_014117 [Hibiscus sabdariffa]|uniref:Uncharacterized protein n=2 Tax=Hibiscus sabdariffa TaxID=183260 RepID=A0ABR2AGA4_9ROSI
MKVSRGKKRGRGIGQLIGLMTQVQILSPPNHLMPSIFQIRRARQNRKYHGTPEMVNVGGMKVDLFSAVVREKL